MEMIHGLPAVGLAVDDKARSLFAAALAYGKFLGFKEEPSGKTLVAGAKLHTIGDMPLGYQKKVDRRLGLHIVKSQHLAVFVDLFSGNFPGNDFTEYAIAHRRNLS
jgi:hypothetical protein